MSKRKSLSKKVRFEVFKRDSFTCQYCGNTPPNVILECDHINPVSKGGDNEEDNLITSCFDCNRGKSDNELTSIPKTIQQKQEILKEKQHQIKEYQALLSKVRKQLESDIWEVANCFNGWFPRWELTPQNTHLTIKNFIKILGKNQVLEAMDTACAKIDYADSAFRYFCGICWTTIREGNE